MSRTTPSTILPIQRVMADATPRAWRDGIVLETRPADLVVAFLDGDVTQLRVADADTLVSVGAPVAHHPAAEILSAGGRKTTARVA
ncbi:nuclease [Curtobacterium sp. AB451]|uniref:nuclease n=1 Tax=unclassified Curtobacterium TaxID=257496 RepID=UPI003804B2AF